MYQPLLSVIVPCYNVEKYLDKCILSIVNQTYTNLEILLIDDGSTDSTGIMCDAWQERDQRIRVIHKRNEGLSYARKTGVENMTSEYVAFVDADDWIDENMYNDMMKAMISTNSDIAQCDFCKVFEDGRIEHHSKESKNGEVEVIGCEEGVLLILENKKWQSYMWNKLFKKHLFEHIEFPKGRVYEDMPIMPALFHNASQTVYIHKTYCFYYQRNDSITNDLTFPKYKTSQHHYALSTYDRYIFVKQHPQYHSILISLKKSATLANLYSLWDMIDYPQCFQGNTYEEQIERLKQLLPLQGGGIFYVVRQDFVILKIIPRFYKLFYKIFFRKSFYKCIFLIIRRVKNIFALYSLPRFSTKSLSSLNK